MEIVLEVFGDFACFTPSWGKVERTTYPFPTPSAARGILSAVYAKPVEFYWQVDRIEVLRPIRYMAFAWMRSCQRNRRSTLASDQSSP